jgi:hypothetical protein
MEYNPNTYFKSSQFDNIINKNITATTIIKITTVDNCLDAF